jgi:hypothetical protein
MLHHTLDVTYNQMMGLGAISFIGVMLWVSEIMSLLRGLNADTPDPQAERHVMMIILDCIGSIILAGVSVWAFVYAASM